MTHTFLNARSIADSRVAKALQSGVAQRYVYYVAVCGNRIRLHTTVWHADVGNITLDTKSHRTVRTVVPATSFQVALGGEGEKRRGPIIPRRVPTRCNTMSFAKQFYEATIISIGIGTMKSRLTVFDEIPLSLSELVGEGLSEFNARTKGLSNLKNLALSIEGVVGHAGGLIGRTVWGWLFIK
ncbi:hypothetical protein [Burkholderia singularis]|uniref:hypothetical protein n=1 Tax=Burkholderia singularis TaxID=1503053 RepID=UPI000F79DF59|nr:hypothetical protein [Burkholderia singularis]